ncbi:hypothetical protein E4U42_000333 [Claviceps africana]|uniref:SET domain-containing protein n=1 Tax=Claviceps africana TaxID=83212 RepID=A0A8K0JAR6_9HYPO|nr:hypothetical protein E4U42_000333 [Claviceps africana]
MAHHVPMEAFPAWAHFTRVQFTGVKLQDVGHGKGLGLVVAAESGLEGRAVEEQKEAVLRVPRDVVLSAEAVDEYAKVDHNFKQLLDVAGQKFGDAARGTNLAQSTRGNILLYLVSHLAQGRSPAGLTTTPWTQYMRFLPRPVPVPTMWSFGERRLLHGTSLETALKAKLATLQSEFEMLHDLSEDLPFWNTLFWVDETISLQDWLLVDAWYRSRCLELPGLGTAMVPALDMVNHSSQPFSLYEVDENEDVVLVVRPEVDISEGEEMTISYGAAKSASEMLFNYGFVDPTNAGSAMTLPLHPFPDDPLAKAKVHIFHGAKTLHLSLKADKEAGGEDKEEGIRRCTWHSPFVYLMCLNEEDGLSFQLLQDTEGGRNLRLFWQDQDVTERADDFEALIRGHKLYQVFRLRAVTVVLQTVEEQLGSIRTGQCDAELELLQIAGELRPDCIAAAKALKDAEEQLLAEAWEALGHERDALLTDEDVVAYLGSTEGFDTEADFS